MNDIRAIARRFEPVGSRVTCNPAPTDTDEDFLVLIDVERFSEFYQLLMVEGYELGGSVPLNEKHLDKDDCFSSFTLGDTNLIVTASEVFFDRFMLATAEAKEKNLLEKSERIALFQSILYPEMEVEQTA
jgi:hypothetical protein